MANPVIKELPENTWTLVAEDVTTGSIWERSLVSRIMMTYVVTGDPAPTDLSDAVHVFVGDCNFLPISAAAAIDVYLYALNQDGEVRADL